MTEAEMRIVVDRICAKRKRRHPEYEHAQDFRDAAVALGLMAETAGGRMAATDALEAMFLEHERSYA